MRASNEVSTRPALVLAIAIAATWATATPAQSAGEPINLTPIADCPDDPNQDEDCRMGAIVADTNTSILRTPRANVVQKQFLVSARLNDGPIRRYSLNFKQPVSDYFARTNHSGPIAYQYSSLGHEHLVVYTNQGALEIRTKEVGLEGPPSLAVVDQRSRRVLARYYDRCINPAILSTAAGKTFWDEARSVCVSTVTGRVAPPNTCTRQKSNGCRIEVPTTFTPEPMPLADLHAMLRDLQALELAPISHATASFGGTSGWGVTIAKVPGKPLLIVHAAYDHDE